jgi:hypothetical protein
MYKYVYSRCIKYLFYMEREREREREREKQGAVAHACVPSYSRG